MATDYIRYDLLTRDALLGVVRKVLTDAAENGLPGEHHFYITFLTKADGVDIAQRLRTQFPDEMTIILQHQFWDLKVSEQQFEVGLSFGGIPERLVIPFSAIKGFFDPSVNFGSAFDMSDNPAAKDGATDGAPTLTSIAGVPAVETKADVQGSRKGSSNDSSKGATPDIAEADASKTDKPSEGGAEVVRLDRFRKK